MSLFPYVGLTKENYDMSVCQGSFHAALNCPYVVVCSRTLLGTSTSSEKNKTLGVTCLSRDPRFAGSIPT